MSDRTALDSLIEMGFPPARAEKALTLTGNQGIESAMDWLMEHEDDVDADDEAPSPPGGHPSGPGSPAEGSGRPEAPVRAEGEEKPPLSEEEKREQTKRMLELVAQKQRERGEREQREAVERERQRRRQGQELSAARQRLQEDEMRRAAEERRRERAEETAARQRVREKIERDKMERAKKFGGAGPGAAAAAAASSPASEPGPVPSSPSQEPPTKREYDQCRIQVRLPDGSSLTQTFRAREQLAAVRLYVELHRGDEAGGVQDPVQLLSGFPRRAFSEADMERPLQELGLVPSAVLIVAKKCSS
ncbi:UBX domain-containing protein 1 [Tachyglossus aculeatus]|uniref:UBX domain-containing protein 1 n=1 Tax=Tachyglossus aculeatus TaxID=9261 RepID=UPI0018F6B834|nr:UBX domain-containing protein 1 [Tachyglossus aculeatus]